MNYSQIVATALAYTDRTNDPEAVAIVDNMLKMVEARINRGLLTMASSARTYVPIVDATIEYYSLPTGFSSFRSVKISTTMDSTAKRVTLEYANPAKMNDIQTNSTFGNWYCIEANMIQIHSPARVVGSYIEYVNYADLIPLSITAPDNWMSDNYPDCYVNGLIAELFKFVRDWDSASAYEKMFTDSIADIDLQDDRLTWSGGSLFTQVG